MESIYYVMSWLCHRTCPHCYEDRFRPYYGEDLARVVEQARLNAGRIIENLPASMTYLDLSDPDASGEPREKIGRIILAGGEILLDPVRQSVLYPALEQLARKYKAQGGVKTIIQTTGDVIDEPIVKELLDRGVWMISVSGIDGYHAGLEKEDARTKLVGKLTAMFERCGMQPKSSVDSINQRFYHFFGATPGSWIGELWPRGRAMINELSTATYNIIFATNGQAAVIFKCSLQRL
ncbi:MAG: radical SAM protein [Bryobacteraceae bacterium]